MKFIDEATIRVRGGDGGQGSASFYRAPFVPKGGPDGGNGGKGGDIILHATAQLATLEDLTLRNKYVGESGRDGSGSRKAGKSGRDLTIDLPVGTLVYDADSNELITDLADPGQTIVIAPGGRGGRGNVTYATSRNQSPRKGQEGKPGEERRLRLELKLLADVGIVGRPNAGKSTLLAALSHATPRIAEYPFSTLSPALGVVPVGYGRFVMADIPGLIEGAHLGKGLGQRFLRHIERTRIILILVETPEPDYPRVYREMVEELESFSPELAALPRLVFRSKSDLPKPKGRRKVFRFDGSFSALTGEGCAELVALIAEKLGLAPVTVP